MTAMQNIHAVTLGLSGGMIATERRERRNPLRAHRSQISREKIWASYWTKVKDRA